MENKALSVLDEVKADITNRRACYKHTFHQSAAMMKILYRNRVINNSAEFHKEIALVGAVIGKLTRFVNSKGRHYDSIKDAAAYCALMAGELDKPKSAAGGYNIDAFGELAPDAFKSHPARSV